MVQLSDTLLADLDDAARRHGLSRSALIRQLVLDGLRQLDAGAVGQRIADGYRRVPQATPDAWGDVTRGADAAAEEVLTRLDAEERTAGAPPW